MQKHEAAVDKDANPQRERRRKRFLSNLVASLCLFFFCQSFFFSVFLSVFLKSLCCDTAYSSLLNRSAAAVTTEVLHISLPSLSGRTHFQSNAPKLSKEWSSIRNICQPADFKEQEQSWCCCIATELLNEVPPNFLAISPPTLCQCHQVTPSSRHQHTSTLMSVMFWANLPFTTLSPTRCSIWLCVSTMIAAS